MKPSSQHATKKKTPTAQLEREIATALAPRAISPGSRKRLSTHHHSRANVPIGAVSTRGPNRTYAQRERPRTYRLRLTPDEMRAVEFASGRYAWADMLAVHVTENGSIAFTDNEMGQWVDDVDSDDAPFPLAAPRLVDKLTRFYESRIG